MKYLLVFVGIVLTLPNHVHAQINEQSLKGTWVLAGIQGDEELIANQQKYLKYTFSKGNRLSIATSPFDRSGPFRYELRNDYIDAWPKNMNKYNYNNEPSKILNLSDYNLQIQNVNLIGDTITLTFEKLNSKMLPEKIIYEPIIFARKRMHFLFQTTSLFLHYTFQPKSHMYLQPMFKRFKSMVGDRDSFSSSIVKQVLFPEFLIPNVFSEEIVISMIVDERGGFKKLKVEKGIDRNVDSSLLEFFSKTKWEPVIVNGIYYEVEQEFHFNFLDSRSLDKSTSELTE